MSRFTDDIARYLQEEGVSSPKDATAKELYNAVSHAAMRELVYIKLGYVAVAE